MKGSADNPVKSTNEILSLRFVIPNLFIVVSLGKMPDQFSSRGYRRGKVWKQSQTKHSKWISFNFVVTSLPSPLAFRWITSVTSGRHEIDSMFSADMVSMISWLQVVYRALTCCLPGMRVMLLEARSRLTKTKKPGQVENHQLTITSITITTTIIIILVRWPAYAGHSPLETGSSSTNSAKTSTPSYSGSSRIL